MRVDLLTREYPPEVYGGAGVHVEYLARELRRLVDVRVHCFGRHRETSRVSRRTREPADLAGANAALRTLGVDLAMAAGCEGADLVHCHTWYANLAGHLAKLLHGVPHVVTAHSLEPLRPWKAEQLGGGYALSSWGERTALRGGRRGDRGLGRACATTCCAATRTSTRTGCTSSTTASTPRSTSPTAAPTCWSGSGIDPTGRRVVFVGRITRQKGLPHLLRAALVARPGGAARAAAPARRTPPEIAAEVSVLVDGAARATATAWSGSRRCCRSPRSSRSSRHATVFVCPSIYEPMGIVNLEAMACETPVVATATGGIPEVVADGETGLLVPIEQVGDGTGTPLDPDRFVADLAAALSKRARRPGAGPADGRAGRRRAVEQFSWAAIATRTLDLYRTLL